MKLTILQGDIFQRIAEIPSDSIDLCITSPPYWGLRAYGTEQVVIGGDKDCQHEFNEFIRPSENKRNNDNTMQPKAYYKDQVQGKCPKCGAWRGEYGSEPTMEAYLNNTLRWVKEVWRVLKPTGSFVLNIGDCFFTKRSLEQTAQVSNSIGYVQKRQGFPEEYGFYRTKQFLSVSSFAYCRIVSETDFVCRGEHIWAKVNVPSPIRSRLKHSHEKLFWFVKDADKYYFDAKAWMTRIKSQSKKRNERNTFVDGAHADNIGLSATSCYRSGQSKKYLKQEENIENSWRIVPVGAKQSGFESEAAFRDAKKMLKRLTAKYLKSCKTEEDRKKAVERAREETKAHYPDAIITSEHIAPFPENLIRPYVESLCPPNGTVLDPFLGSGTTMRVAMEENKDSIGIELNEKYVEYAKKRLNWGSGLNAKYQAILQEQEARK